MLKVFKNYFLGQGKAASKCKILNEDDIIVYYVVKENALYAKSINPIVVENNYLGYLVHFDLHTFQLNFSIKSIEDKYMIRSFYAGLSFFEDINPKKTEKRQKVYSRSLKRFFKVLTGNKIEKTKFTLGHRRFAVKPNKLFTIKAMDNELFQVLLQPKYRQTKNGKFIPTTVTLQYKNDLSSIIFLKPYTRVDQFGNNIDIENLLLVGKLSESRVSKMLPKDYSTP